MPYSLSIRATANDFEGHSLVARHFKCNSMNICASFRTVQLTACRTVPWQQWSFLFPTLCSSSSLWSVLIYSSSYSRDTLLLSHFCWLAAPRQNDVKLAALPLTVATAVSEVLNVMMNSWQLSVSTHHRHHCSSTASISSLSVTGRSCLLLMVYRTICLSTSLWHQYSSLQSTSGDILAAVLCLWILYNACAVICRFGC